MLIIPAIDIQLGRVVRLTQGRFDDKKIYSSDPLKAARHWAKQGAKLIHIVDLDGAKTGEPKNLSVVKDIIKAVGVPVEFGGGVRKQETIDKLIGYGVRRVVLGTKAVQDILFLKKSFKDFKDKVIVSIDASGLEVLIKGWQQKAAANTDALSFSGLLKNIGFKEFIYTDVRKDGMLSGPNIKDIKKLLKETGMKIIASGGVSSLEDIRKLKALEKDGLCGMIIGKALYEGKFTLQQALKLA